METVLNKNKWYVICRKGTNELLINKSGAINVCEKYHLSEILWHLNRYAETWIAMTIADYDLKFGDFKCNLDIEYEYVTAQ